MLLNTRLETFVPARHVCSNICAGAHKKGNQTEIEGLRTLCTGSSLKDRSWRLSATLKLIALVAGDRRRLARRPLFIDRTRPRRCGWTCWRSGSLNLRGNEEREYRDYNENPSNGEYKFGRRRHSSPDGEAAALSDFLHSEPPWRPPAASGCRGRLELTQDVLIMGLS
jgi:hypothetical protein